MNSWAAGPGVLRRGLVALRCSLLWAAWLGMAGLPAQACEGAQHVRLRQPVAPSPQELAEFRAMAPLRVLSVDAPPMARYDAARDAYGGIGVDVWCFITGELGLRYEIVAARQQTVADKIRQVQEGRADVFMPLSLQPERARRGTFTLPYYASYYAIIARKGRRLPVHGVNDLTPYRVGVVKGVALEPRLQAIVPAAQLTSFDQINSDGMFQALLEGTLDVAVFSKSIFEEKRYTHDYFDLEVIHTLGDDPREYSFYLVHRGIPWKTGQRLSTLMPEATAIRRLNCSTTRHFRHWAAGQAIGLNQCNGRKATAARCRCISKL